VRQPEAFGGITGELSHPAPHNIGAMTGLGTFRIGGHSARMAAGKRLPGYTTLVLLLKVSASRSVAAASFKTLRWPSGQLGGLGRRVPLTCRVT
jgi:hypothetical protein